MSTVLTSDGVELSVAVTGPSDAEVAVVLIHGWCLSSEIYRKQQAALADAPVRVVTYDKRGHGRSGKAPHGSTTIARVAEDLRAVIEATCDELPVILVGHSLGGMTIMALAELKPSLFCAGACEGAGSLDACARDPAPSSLHASRPGLGTCDGRVAGVVFVNTAAGDLDNMTLGFPKRIAALVRTGLPREFARRHKAHLRRGDGPVRRRLTDAAFAKFILFGRGACREDVRLGRRLIATTHPGIMSGFYGEFTTHNRHEALRQLSQVPVRILAGGSDRLTPAAHSRRIAKALPSARLSVFPGAGHMIPLERPEDLTTEILHLARHATTVTT